MVKKDDKDLGMLDLLNAAAEKRDDGFKFLLDGDLSQMAAQMNFLRSQGFVVGKVDVYPALETKEEYLRAIKAIWENRIEGWWHYKKELVEELKVCTLEEFRSALG